MDLRKNKVSWHCTVAGSMVLSGDQVSMADREVEGAELDGAQPLLRIPEADAPLPHGVSDTLVSGALHASDFIYEGAKQEIWWIKTVSTSALLLGWATLFSVLLTALFVSILTFGWAKLLLAIITGNLT